MSDAVLGARILLFGGIGLFIAGQWVRFTTERTWQTDTYARVLRNWAKVVWRIGLVMVIVGALVFIAMGL